MARGLVQKELFGDAEIGRGQRAEKLLAVHEALCRAYDVKGYLEREKLLDPLSDLIHALLGHRTRYEDNDRAFHRLLDRFGNWSAVRDAPFGEVVREIQGVTWPDQKAMTIQKVLREISERKRGKLALEFLKRLSVGQARRWLESLPGVGPKTSAIVLLYSTLKMPAHVVDTHHYRVSSRLGLVPQDIALERAEKFLDEITPADWTVSDYADHHLALFTHGQECCTFTAPKCQRCPVLKHCPFGKARLGTRFRRVK